MGTLSGDRTAESAAAALPSMAVHSSRQAVIRHGSWGDRDLQPRGRPPDPPSGTRGRGGSTCSTMSLGPHRGAASCPRPAQARKGGGGWTTTSGSTAVMAMAIARCRRHHRGWAGTVVWLERVTAGKEQQEGLLLTSALLPEIQSASQLTVFIPPPPRPQQERRHGRCCCRLLLPSPRACGRRGITPQWQPQPQGSQPLPVAYSSGFREAAASPRWRSTCPVRWGGPVVQ